jgi:hypothetical protein
MTSLSLWFEIDALAMARTSSHDMTTIVVIHERQTMSTVSMRRDEFLISAARTAAKAEFRTVQGQVEFWAKVGRAALDNLDSPASFIAESLMSLAEPREDSTPFAPCSRPRSRSGATQA